MWTRSASIGILLLALVATGCARHPRIAPAHQITVYYCRGGTEALVPLRYPVASDMDEARVASFALNQLLTGPGALSSAVVLFPAGTRGTVTLSGDTATVDLGGAIESHIQAGSTGEIAMLKSLTYTLTDLPGITRVRVLVAGKTVAALPGGNFDLGEPLTRQSFEQ